MSKAHDITPAKFRCGDMDALCPSIHETENGIILIGQHVSRGELTNMEIGASQGEGAIRLSREFLDAFFMEFAAKQLANAK